MKVRVVEISSNIKDLLNFIEIEPGTKIQTNLKEQLESQKKRL